MPKRHQRQLRYLEWQKDNTTKAAGKSSFPSMAPIVWDDWGEDGHDFAASMDNQIQKGNNQTNWNDNSTFNALLSGLISSSSNVSVDISVDATPTSDSFSNATNVEKTIVLTGFELKPTANAQLPSGYLATAIAAPIIVITSLIVLMLLILQKNQRSNSSSTIPVTKQTIQDDQADDTTESESSRHEPI